ncbi:MAG: Sulfotransferase [Phycisphaerales bacterium]|nr:Sulfotransferase [Phycisphaerales bacterium]
MKRSRLVSEKAMARMLQSAGECWRRGEIDEYFALMENARRSDPGNHAILLDLGAAHGARYDYAKAEECFERAAALAPGKSEALAMAGLHCRNFNRHEMAERYFERAAEQKGASADTFAKLAELHERLRRLDAAGKAVDRALALDPSSALALLVRARLDRSAGKLEEAEKVVRSFLARTDAQSWSTRIRGWYELGAILDKQGRYDEAMAAFVQGKALIQPNAVKYIAAQRSVHIRLKEATANISADVLRRWREAGAALGPPRRLALLGGHPRSGTTLLEQVLDSHPQVVSAEETAIFFETYLSLKRGFQPNALMFSVLDSATPAALRQARESYFRSVEMFLGEPVGDRLLVDKNPSLTGLVPGLVRVLPEAKFLVALRDPRDVCLSCFMQPLPLNEVSSIFLTLDGAADEYVSLMGFWRAMSPRLTNPHLEVRYEDLVNDLGSISRMVLEFLGLPWDERVMKFDEHARQKLVRSPTYAEVARPISKGAVGRWRNYQKYLEPSLQKLEPFVKAFDYEQ